MDFRLYLELIANFNPLVLKIPPGLIELPVWANNWKCSRFLPPLANSRPVRFLMREWISLESGMMRPHLNLNANWYVKWV